MGQIVPVAALWRVPAAERMKNRLPHFVPLAPPVLALLDDLAEYTEPEPDDYLVPSARSRTRPVSIGTVDRRPCNRRSALRHLCATDRSVRLDTEA